jgi:hypothetical protein
MTRLTSRLPLSAHSTCLSWVIGALEDGVKEQVHIFETHGSIQKQLLMPVELSKHRLVLLKLLTAQPKLSYESETGDHGPAMFPRA